MINRVETLNGRLEYKTSPGNGCTLLVNIPIIELADITQH
jgi:signal transduction histidine kinase